MLTFFYETGHDIDLMYDNFKAVAETPPIYNSKYNIYHFFASDPEGRKLEFQYFEEPVTEYLSGEELLLTRRSVRHFKKSVISETILEKVLDISRFAPTSVNSQSYYFQIIRDKSDLKWLSEVRGKSSSPIGRAPLAIAICADPEISKRHVQDGCIAAYHLMLSAWFYGLGTCWIAALDRDDVKDELKIPQSHYVVTVTPLGYPEKLPLPAPERKDLSWFLRK